MLVLQVNPKLEQTVTARWSNADRNRKQTGSPQGAKRKSARGRQEVRRGQTGSPQGADRKSTRGRQEVHRGQTGRNKFFHVLQSAQPLTEWAVTAMKRSEERRVGKECRL